MKSIRLIIAFGLGLWAYVSLWGQTPFDNAINAYKNGQYSEARDLFSAMEREGYQDAALYYNLGNTYYALNDLGRSILYFEKASRIEPHNHILRQNLEIARSKCADDFLIIPDFFIWRWIKSFSLSWSATAWMWCSVGFAWVIVIVLMAFWWQKLSRMWLVVALGSLGLTWITVTGLGWIRQYLHQHHQQGIIIPQEVVLRAAPDAQSAELFKLHAGLKVTMVDTLNRWQKVELPNKETGWLRPEEIIKI